VNKRNKAWAGVSDELSKLRDDKVRLLAIIHDIHTYLYEGNTITPDNTALFFKDVVVVDPNNPTITEILRGVLDEMNAGELFDEAGL